MWIDEIKAIYETKQNKDELFIRICPNCGNTRWNFQINITKQIVHCWNCKYGGSLYKFVNDFNLNLDIPKIPYVPTPSEIKIQEHKLNLPKNSYPILTRNSYYVEKAINYLKDRKITKADILKFNIMLTEDIKYFGRIIFPFYKNGELIFFTARDFFNTSYLPYLTPKGISKGILPFIQGNDTLTITEGIIDTIKIYNAFKHTVLPLLGKELINEQFQELIKYSFNKVYICLDPDVKLKELYNLQKKLSKYFITEVILLKYKDAGEHNIDELQKSFKQSKPIQEIKQLLKKNRNHRLIRDVIKKW